MIRLTRLNDSVFVLNCDMIVMVEATPDTVITTTEGKKYICKETVDELIDRVIEFKGRIQIFVNSYR